MQTEKKLGEKIIDDVRHLFGDSCFTAQEERHNLMSWVYDEEFCSIERLVDLLIRLQQTMDQTQEEIPGISVLVQRTGLPARSSQLNSSMHQLYLLPEQNGIWCTQGVAELIGSSVRLWEDEGFLKIEEFKRDGPDVAVKPGLFRLDDLPDRLADHVIDSYQKESREVTVLTGPKGSGKQMITGEVLSLLEGKSPSQPWLRIRPDDEMGPPSSFLLTQFDTRILSAMDRYLEGMDRILWTELRDFHSSPSHTWADADGRIFFLLYLKAYKRYTEESLLLPLVIVHNWDEVPQEIRTFLIKHLQTKRDSFHLFVTMTGRMGKEAFPESKEFSVEEWLGEIGKEGAGELKTSYELCYPEDILAVQASPQARAKELLKRLHEEAVSVYYQAALLNGLLKKKALLELLEEGGIHENKAEQHLSQLVSLGLLTDRKRFYAVDSELKGSIRRDFSLDFEQIHHRIEGRLLEKIESLPFLRLLRTAVEIPFSGEGWEKLFRTFAARLFSDMEVSPGPFVERINELTGDRFPGIIRLLRMLTALGEGEMEKAGRFFREIDPGEAETDRQEEAETGWKRVLLLYMKGEYFWRRRTNGEEALMRVKSALLDVQETGFPELESRALLLLGKIMLTGGRLTEAAEYFRQARQKTFDTSLTAVACESIALTALTNFLTGDYSLALSHAAASEQKARQSGRRRWERYVRMLRGRIEFELGRYPEASVVFQSLLTQDQLYFDGGKHEYFKAWVARAFMYQGYVGKAVEILGGLHETAEVLFFLAEAQILNRNIADAAGYVEKALELMEEEEGDILPIELLPGDGFEPYENLALKIPGVYSTLRQLLYALKGFLLHEQGLFDSSREAFYKLFEQEKISRQDPYRHLYYYFFTITLPVSGEKEELNMVTYLSKSFQSLQRIAGKISEPADRRSYITMNYWNSRLYNLSREYKLI
jgi:tetratricopeptide (TPR) repeat protein